MFYLYSLSLSTNNGIISVVKTEANIPDKNDIPPFSSPQKLKLNTNEIKQYIIIQNLYFDPFLPFQLPSSLTKKLLKAPPITLSFLHAIFHLLLFLMLFITLMDFSHYILLIVSKFLFPFVFK